MERGSFHLMRIGNAMRRGSEDRFVGQVLANIMATCIIARVLAHNLDVWFVSWLTSKVLDVCLLFYLEGPIWPFAWLTVTGPNPAVCGISVWSNSTGQDLAFAWSVIFMV